jgi:hypothetical protein
LGDSEERIGECRGKEKVLEQSKIARERARERKRDRDRDKDRDRDG